MDIKLTYFFKFSDIVELYNNLNNNDKNEILLIIKLLKIHYLNNICLYKYKYKKYNLEKRLSILKDFDFRLEKNKLTVKNNIINPIKYNKLKLYFIQKKIISIFLLFITFVSVLIINIIPNNNLNFLKANILNFNNLNEENYFEENDFNLNEEIFLNDEELNDLNDLINDAFEGFNSALEEEIELNSALEEEKNNINIIKLFKKSFTDLINDELNEGKYTTLIII